jgi:hypothetical protein
MMALDRSTPGRVADSSTNASKEKVEAAGVAPRAANDVRRSTPGRVADSSTNASKEKVEAAGVEPAQGYFRKLRH